VVVLGIIVQTTANVVIIYLVVWSGIRVEWSVVASPLGPWLCLRFRREVASSIANSRCRVAGNAWRIASSNCDGSRGRCQFQQIYQFPSSFNNERNVRKAQAPLSILRFCRHQSYCGWFTWSWAASRSSAYTNLLRLQPGITNLLNFLSSVSIHGSYLREKEEFLLVLYLL